MDKLLRYILWPFGKAYGGVMQLRNRLYDLRIFGSRRFELPVIAVGNLTVGGTGKTPHVEYLLRLLQNYKVATLSRGYKRQSKGFVLADDTATPALLGDEPFQYHADFEDVAVAVCEKRVKGIEYLQQRLTELEVVVLDDAMQHRAVEPSLNILITDFNNPFYRDLVLPAGRLREPRSGARRADAVVVSKCPASLTGKLQERISEKVEAYTRPGVPVFFSTYAYGAPVPLGVGQQPTREVVLVTGIANAEPLKKYLGAENIKVLRHIAYPDHHQYTAANLRELQQLLQESGFKKASILTTRKDAVKLTDATLQPLTAQLPIFYVPIEVRFLAEQEVFDLFVLQHVQERVRL